MNSTHTWCSVNERQRQALKTHKQSPNTHTHTYTWYALIKHEYLDSFRIDNHIRVTILVVVVSLWCSRVYLRIHRMKIINETTTTTKAKQKKTNLPLIFSRVDVECLYCEMYHTFHTCWWWLFICGWDDCCCCWYMMMMMIDIDRMLFGSHSRWHLPYMESWANYRRHAHPAQIHV